MTKIAIYNLEGKSVSERTLSDSVFETKANEKVLSQAVVTQLANRRNSIASTKDRGAVSGGGKKPFKQKGTGNARAGSSRSPLWIGGGVTFGPSSAKNYKKKIQQKVTNLALRDVLSKKAADKKIILLEDFSLPKISTKQVFEIFSRLPIEEGKILVILPKIDINTELSLSNIPYAKVLKIDNLNIFDIMKYDYILTTVEAMDKIEKALTGTGEKEVKPALAKAVK